MFSIKANTESAEKSIHCTSIIGACTHITGNITITGSALGKITVKELLQLNGKAK